MTDQMSWGIISTGAIARAFAHGVAHSRTGRVTGVASRCIESANTFADEFGIDRRYGSYPELLADPSVQAVYIATPHPMHAQWVIAAAEAGKHILCEKPLALNHAQGMAMIQAAREHNVFLMEAFMYRCHPQTARIIELIREGAIGDVRVISAQFGFNVGDAIDPGHRLVSNALGGGGIMDIGCYTVSMSRLIAGAALGRPFAEPIRVTGAGHVGSTGVDEWASAVLTFENDMIANIAAAIRAQLDNRVVIVGSEGRITVPNPWQGSRTEAHPGEIILDRKGRDTQIMEVPTSFNSFSLEADVAARSIAEGRVEAESPAMNWDDSLGNLAALDAWRSELGVVYEDETPAKQGNQTAAGRPIRVRGQHNMRYQTIEGLAKPISRFVLGSDNQRNFAHGAAFWDDWFERGGNAFDTAWIYGRGAIEQMLGQWIQARGVRDQVVVIVKGAHTPRCMPDLIIRDFHESLERLRFDHADIYFMHRDNLDVPVGEFADALNGLIDQGLIRGAIGGSNWTLDRIAELNEYCNTHGKQGFTALSNNLSLAEMVRPVWKGCLHVSDPQSRQWLAEHQIANFAWSSQARGYFLPEDQRMKLGRDNFECWDSPDNRARRDRAEELARQKGVSPINIAAAYVLSQPFPSFALIGPRTIRETADCFPALDVGLTAEELDWLWHGSAVRSETMTRQS